MSEQGSRVLTEGTEAGAEAAAVRQEVGTGPATAAAVAVTVDVVIPVLNEAHVLEKSVNTLREYLAHRFPYQWRVVIVDNGSTDGTQNVALGLSARYSDITFWRLDERGRGRALRHAWTQSDADIVCYMDVDLSTELAALPRLVAALVDQGYDIAVGSRLMKASHTVRSFKREVISRAYNLMIKVLFLTPFSDAQCGFKGVTRRVVERVVPQIQDQSWFFDTELLLLGHRQNYAIRDIPVVWIEDDDSRVKIVRTAWDDIKGLLRLRWLFWKQSWFGVRRRSRVPVVGGEAI
jgi:glycosyltransferase involved in cell wall biosynthesis